MYIHHKKQTICDELLKIWWKTHICGSRSMLEGLVNCLMKILKKTRTFVQTAVNSNFKSRFLGEQLQFSTWENINHLRISSHIIPGQCIRRFHDKLLRWTHKWLVNQKWLQKRICSKTRSGDCRSGMHHQHHWWYRHGLGQSSLSASLGSGIWSNQEQHLVRPQLQISQHWQSVYKSLSISATVLVPLKTNVHASL